MAHRQALSLDCGHHGTKSRTNPLVDANFMVDITENVFELPGQSIRVVGRKTQGAYSSTNHSRICMAPNSILFAARACLLNAGSCWRVNQTETAQTTRHVQSRMHLCALVNINASNRITKTLAHDVAQTRATQIN